MSVFIPQWSTDKLYTHDLFSPVYIQPCNLKPKWKWKIEPLHENNLSSSNLVHNQRRDLTPKKLKLLHALRSSVCLINHSLSLLGIRRIIFRTRTWHLNLNKIVASLICVGWDCIYDRNFRGNNVKFNLALYNLYLINVV